MVNAVGFHTFCISGVSCRLYIAAFEVRHMCRIFLDQNGLGRIFAVAAGHFVGQYRVLVLVHGAFDLLGDTLSGGNCDVVPCGFAGGGQSLRQGIVQGNGTVSITAIGHGDNKLDLVALYIVCLFIFYGFAQMELRPLRSRNFQFHAVSANGRVAGIVTVGLAGDGQAVGDLAVCGAVHLHGAAVQRQCHVQINCGHFRIGVLAVHGEADLGSASAVDGLYAQVAGGVACCRNGRLDGIFHRGLCTTGKGHFRQRNGVLEFQGLHPFRAGLFGRVVGRCAQGIVYSSALCNLLCFQRSAVFSLGSAPLHCSVCGDLIGHALSGAFLCQLDFHRSAVCSLSVLELRL